jgi:membrane-associated phospholipid phosphatase
MLKKIFTRVIKESTSFGDLLFYLFIFILIASFVNYKTASLFFIQLMLIYSITFIIRMFYFKERPKKMEFNNILEKLDASSFPSVLAARATSLFIFSAIHFYDKYLIMVFACLFWIIVCYSRIYLKKHDIIDVLVGVILGALCSTVYIFE